MKYKHRYENGTAADFATVCDPSKATLIEYSIWMGKIPTDFLRKMIFEITIWENAWTLSAFGMIYTQHFGISYVKSIENE